MMGILDNHTPQDDSYIAYNHLNGRKLVESEKDYCLAIPSQIALKFLELSQNKIEYHRKIQKDPRVSKLKVQGAKC